MEEFYSEDEKKGFVRDTMKKLSSHLPKTDVATQHRLLQLEQELKELASQVKFFEGESDELMQKLERNLHEFEILRRKYYRVKEQQSESLRRNEQLAAKLQELKTLVREKQEEIDNLCAPPNSYGTFIAVNPDHTIDLDNDGRRLRVNVRPGIDPAEFEAGQQLILNEAYNVIGVAGQESKGEIGEIKELLGDGRVIVSGRADEEKVVALAEELRHEKLAVGDNLLINARSNYAIERLPKTRVAELVLEEVPDVTYADIGGLDAQIEKIRDALELPYLYPAEFEAYKLTPPKGILLYGPPGCGKTMVAKAIANSLAQKMEAKTGVKAKSYFLNVKGPELLNKYVGETESKLRQVFARAKEKASAETPVVVFFDEMDALFRLRGSGISSDMEATVVAQFLSEIDGVEALRNVIIIGASNRQDLIDPAVLRPGRLDLKIKIERPEQAAAKAIFAKYLTADLPLAEDELRHNQQDAALMIRYFIDAAVSQMYKATDENRFLEVTYAKGSKEIYYFKDFVSGAMIEHIVRRAKKSALKRALAAGQAGLRLEDLLAAVKEEFKENEELPNTTNPDDWARIAGRKGEKVIDVRMLRETAEEEAGRKVETIMAGQYL